VKLAFALQHTSVRVSVPVDRVDAYRHFAAQCVALAHHTQSPHDRTLLLEMAMVWSRLAEYAAKIRAPQESAEPPKPADPSVSPAAILP
jgi:hypothetical protein